MEKTLIEKLREINAGIRSKNFSPFYFLYGEEDFFINKLESDIKKNFNDATKLNIKVYDTDNFDIDEVIKYVINMPLMNDKKLIVFKDIELFREKEKKNKNEEVITNNSKSKGTELIEAFAKSIETNIVLVIMHEYEKKYEQKYQKGNIFVDYFTENGIVINLEKLDENELTKYVINKFKTSGIEIDKVLAMYLIKLAGKSLISLYNEIDKILSYIGDRTKVSKEDIEVCVSKNIEDNVFKLVDFINTNRQNDALNLYGDLLSEGINQFSIFSILTNNYKDMMIVKSMIEKSKSLKEIAETTRFPEWKVRNIMNASKGITKDDIAKKLYKVTKLNTAYMYGNVSENIMLETLFY